MMYPDKYKSEPSKRTPWINMEPGRIFIMGRSIPENPGDFYRPVHKWISEYSENHIEKSKIDLGFEYINTSSTKWIFNMLKVLSEMQDLDENVKVIWYYEQGDEDMCELGFILKSLIECPFILVEVEEMNNARYKQIFTLDTF
jgi:SiaC family regulatory phosphoprotein